MSNIINKISIKTVGIKDEELKAGGPLMEVVGQVHEITHGEATNGTYTRFVGIFEAINLKSGEVYRAGALFLPNVAGNLVEAAFEDLNGDKEVPSVMQIAFEINSIPSETSNSGYTYSAKNLMPADAQADPLAHLKASIKRTPALTE